MRLGRRKPPVLAEVGGGRDGAGSLLRGDLEAYGGLLERLGGARVVLVSGGRDGKGAVPVRLAATAAASGRRTVLLECDLAEPTFAATLGLATAPGMSEYLRGEAEATGILQSLVLAGPGSAGASEPLACVVGGRPVRDAWEPLASERLRLALQRLRSAYDLTVLGGPPLEEGHSVAALLGQADSTIACVRRSQVRRRLPVPVSGLVVQG